MKSISLLLAAILSLTAPSATQGSSESSFVVGHHYQLQISSASPVVLVIKVWPDGSATATWGLPGASVRLHDRSRWVDLG